MQSIGSDPKNLTWVVDHPAGESAVCHISSDPAKFMGGLTRL